MTMMTYIPVEGDRFTFSSLTGYVFVQNRPFGCRHGCVCGTCNGVYRETEATVTRVIYWADNSVEVVGVDATGEEYRQTIVAPHGDACF